MAKFYIILTIFEKKMKGLLTGDTDSILHKYLSNDKTFTPMKSFKFSKKKFSEIKDLNNGDV